MMMRIAVLLLLVSFALASPKLYHADSPKVIPGSYIVVLNDGLNSTHRDAHIANLKKTIGMTGADAEITFVYDIILGFAARLTPELLKAELAHPEVKYVEADQVLSINIKQDKISAPLEVVTQTGATWGIVRVSQRQKPTNTNYVYNSTAGSNAVVYVVDTGILITHKDFGTRASFPFNAITNEGYVDGNGHGTHCAGTIGGTTYGVAKQVGLKAVKVLSSSGSGSTAGVVSGVNFVANDNDPRAKVGSMSLGGGASTALDQAVQNSIAAGIPYAIAGGNDNANACNYSPARVPQAVTVGATTNTDARASYSNYGSCTDIFAPGSSITSDWIGSSNDATNTISGTSMATPHVAGVLALQRSDFPGLNPADLKAWVVGQGTKGIVTNPGTSSPDCFLFSPSA